MIVKKKCIVCNRPLEKREKKRRFLIVTCGKKCSATYAKIYQHVRDRMRRNLNGAR